MNEVGRFDAERADKAGLSVSRPLPRLRGAERATAASTSGGRSTGVDGAERDARTSGRRCGDDAPIRATASCQSTAHDADGGFSGVAGGLSAFSSCITSCADDADMDRFRPCIDGASSIGGLTMSDVEAACVAVEYGRSDPDEPSRLDVAAGRVRVVERTVASAGGGGIGLA